MNSINETRSKGFSEVLATMPIMAQTQRTTEPVKDLQGQQGGKSELLKQQFAINESFWKMVLAAGETSVDKDSSRAVETETANSRIAEAAMALRLVSAYGTATTEEIAGRLDTDRLSPASRATVRRTISPALLSPKRVNTTTTGFSLAA
jgi:hypothetical protein